MSPRRIGLMSALPQELAAVLAHMPHEQRQRLAGRDYWPGHVGDTEVVAVVTGIGKVAAATTATLLIERYGVTGMVFTGVAGGLGDGVAVGDVVVANGLLQHDMDASPLCPRHEVPGYGQSVFATEAAWTAQLEQAARRAQARWASQLEPATVATYGLQHPKTHMGLVISGDRFVATAPESQALRQRLPQALAVEMEGAAVAQVCHDFGVPLAVVRTISDRADDSAHVDFNQFVADVASATSASMVLDWLTQLGATQGQK